MWEPTHNVGLDTIPVWATPDPAQPPVAELNAGLPVVAAERRGGWVEVVAANGFRGWVDAGRLVPVSPVPVVQSRSRRSPAPWIALAALVALGVAVAVVLTRDDSEKASTAATSSSALVRFNVPTGWSVSADGLTIAENAADLTAATPSGPRVTAVVGAAEDDDPNVLVRDALGDTSFDIIETPTDTEVSGVAAIQITIRKDNVILRFIGTHPKGKDGVVFTVECPVERFEEVRAQLDAAPGLNL